MTPKVDLWLLYAYAHIHTYVSEYMLVHTHPNMPQYTLIKF